MIEVELRTNPVPANGSYTWSEYSVAPAIPEGYKMIGVSPILTSSNNLYFYNCSVASESKVNVQLKNTSSSQVQGTPKIYLHCILV